MSKFHINKHGVPAPCKATKENCPYGGDSGKENHFDSLAEATEHANSTFEQNHGLLPSFNSHESVPSERRVDLFHATSAQVLQKIINDGELSPPSTSGLTSNGLGFDESAEADGVYLTNDDQNLAMYIDGAVENGTFNEDLPNYGVYIELYADSDNLVVDVDDYEGDDVESATWEDSLEDCNQVVHKGGITADQIKSVTFKGPLNMGKHFHSKKRPVMDMLPIRKKLINGNKLSLDEARELMKSVDEEVERKFA